MNLIYSQFASASGGRVVKEGEGKGGGGKEVGQHNAPPLGVLKGNERNIAMEIELVCAFSPERLCTRIST